jgi:hypothetical protein
MIVNSSRQQGSISIKIENSQREKNKEKRKFIEGSNGAQKERLR